MLEKGSPLKQCFLLAEGKKEGRKEGRKEEERNKERKEGRKEGRKQEIENPQTKNEFW